MICLQVNITSIAEHLTAKIGRVGTIPKVDIHDVRNIPVIKVSPICGIDFSWREVTDSTGSVLYDSSSNVILMKK